MYGVKDLDPVSLADFSRLLFVAKMTSIIFKMASIIILRDLSRAPYVLYGVKYIGLVPLALVHPKPPFWVCPRYGYFESRRVSKIPFCSQALASS